MPMDLTFLIHKNKKIKIKIKIKKRRYMGATK
jgi:hypothetical protein